MQAEFHYTVGDVVKRPLFHNARVIAGRAGLSRRIRWVHILEVPQFDSLVSGEEMILSTGIGHSGLAGSLAFMQRLIESNVSCLCLELGLYLKAVPEEMIELADRYDFPLIVFPGSVRFVDITQDIHTLIINKHYDMLQQLEKVSRDFHRLTLTSQGVWNVLQLLHTSTRNQIAYLPALGKPVFSPNLEGSRRQKLLDSLEAGIAERLQKKEGVSLSSPLLFPDGKRTILAQPVGTMGQTWAYIAMVCAVEPSEYDYLLLDSACLSIAQDLLRNRYLEERQRHTEHVWVNDLVHGRLKDDDRLALQREKEYQALNQSGYRVCLIDLAEAAPKEPKPAEDTEEATVFHLSMSLRAVFEQHNFRPLIARHNRQLIVIAFDLSHKKESLKPYDSRAAFGRVLQQIEHSNDGNQIGAFTLHVGISGVHFELKNAPRGFQEASKALFMQTRSPGSSAFYEDLGIYQLLLQLNDDDTLSAFVHTHLGPLIREDAHKENGLLRTLEVYLEHNGSKQATAAALYIVRQTLYYRLDKIKELLGEAFMDSANQTVLRVALMAYRLLRR